MLFHECTHIFIFAIYVFSIATLHANAISMTEGEYKSESEFSEKIVTNTPYLMTPKVDAVTGTYHEEEVDLIIAGCEPISFHRFYQHKANNPSFGTWIYNPETYAAANFDIHGKDTLFCLWFCVGRCAFIRKKSFLCN